MLQDVRPHLFHEPSQRVARDVNLRDHLGPLGQRADAPSQNPMVIVNVLGDLVRVGPVNLTAGLDVVGGVTRECFGAIHVGEPDELQPVIGRQDFSALRGRRVRGGRTVTGEDPPTQQGSLVRIGRELAVPVQIAFGDPLLEAACGIGDVDQFDHALHLATARQPQADAGDHPEQAVAANRQAEQLGVLVATASDRLAARVDEGERGHVLHHRLESQTPAVGVRGQGAPDAETIGACLLLHDPPGVLLSLLPFIELCDQARPLRPRADLDFAGCGVELLHPLQAVGVDQNGVGAELLATHGVPAGHDRDGPAVAPGAPHQILQRPEIARTIDP